MHKNFLVFIGIVVIAVVGGLILWQFNTGQTQSTLNQSASPQAPVVNDPLQPTPDISNYQEFTAERLAESRDKRQVLFFYANWCPTCAEAQASILDNLSQVPQGVVLLRVNYNDNATDDQEKALARQYGITYQHTFVEIADDGQAINTWNGGGFAELLTQLASTQP